MTIRTNNVPRPLIDAAELTAAERQDFDYLDWPAIDAGRDSATFFRYRGDLHYIGEFMRTTVTHAREGWHGARADSYFSGLFIRLADENESVVVGRWTS